MNIEYSVELDEEDDDFMVVSSKELWFWKSSKLLSGGGPRIRGADFGALVGLVKHTGRALSSAN